MNNQERMIHWLVDAIDTEVEKPEGEADMALVDECSALLGELIGDTCTLSEQELKKRCRAITHGGKPCGRKKIRLIAAIAACLSVFVVMSSCGYLPSITAVLQTLFASGVGKDVEVHEVTYTFDGMSTQYENMDELIASEELDILIPTVLPENTYIIKVLRSNEINNICIIFNNSDLVFHIFLDRNIEDFVKLSYCQKHITENNTVYLKNLSDITYAAYTEFDNDVYYLQYSNTETIFSIIDNMR